MYNEVRLYSIPQSMDISYIVRLETFIVLLLIVLSCLCTFFLYNVLLYDVKGTYSRLNDHQVVYKWQA